MAKQAPKGWEDPIRRKSLAQMLRRRIDDWDTSNQDKRDRYQLAQDVYDGEQTMSSLEFIEDIEPYSMGLLATRVDAVVDSLCEGFAAVKPWFTFKGGGAEDDNEREAMQRDVQLALEEANFEVKIRSTARDSVIKARGPFRIRYVTLKGEPGEERMAVNDPQDGAVIYSGPVYEPIEPDDFVLWPPQAIDVENADMVGHMLHTLTPHEVKIRQETGAYFDEFDIVSGDVQAGVNVSEIQYQPLDAYQLCVRMARNDPLYAGTPNEPSADEGEGDTEELPEDSIPRWYLVTLAYARMEILDMEELNLPRPWYFAPALRMDTNKFLPKQSVGTRLLEADTCNNDAWALLIFGNAASAFTTVGVSNYVGTASTMKAGIGNFVFFKGNPVLTPIPTYFRSPQVLEGMVESIGRIGDALAKASPMGMGAQLEGGNITATEVGGVLAGQSRGTTNDRSAFADELKKAVLFVKLLIGRNFSDFKRYHGASIDTKSAKTWRKHFQVELNSQSTTDSPQTVVNKVESLLSAATQLGLPVKPPTRQLNVDQLLETIVNALNLPTATNKLLEDPNSGPTAGNAQAEPGEPDPIAEALAAIQGAQPGQPAGQAGALDPQLLQRLLALTQGNLPGGAMEPGVGGPIPAIGAPQPPGGLVPGLPAPGPHPAFGGPPGL